MDDDFEALKLEFFEVMREFHQIKPVPFDAVEGLTPAEAKTLHMIFAAEQRGSDAGVRPGFVAGHLHVTPSALSQVLKTLEEKQLVERSRGCDDDFRAVMLRLTPRGAALARDIDARWEEQARGMVDYVGLEELRQMMATTRRIAAYWQERAGAHGVPADDGKAACNAAGGASPCA